MSVYSAPRSIFERLWREPPPSLALEFGVDRVAAAEWAPGAGTLARVASEQLPEGALRPSPVRENIARTDDVKRAVSNLLGRITKRRSGTIALLLPDVTARVSVLDFEQFPEKADEQGPLLRWRLRKTVPFEIDQAALAFQRQGRSSAGEELAVAVAPTEIVQQYEALVAPLGFQPGFVTPSSLAALGLIPRDPRRGTLLLRSNGRLLTIVVTGDDRLRVFRSTEAPAGQDTHALDEVAGDVYSSTVYFQDNFSSQVERIYIAGFGAQTTALEQVIEKEVGIRPQNLVVPGTRGQDESFLGLYGMSAEQARD